MSVSPGAMGRTTGCSRGSSDPTMPPRVTRLARVDPDRGAPSPYSSRPSTLPTPSHVIERSGRANTATLITAPRVPWRARWQRWMSGTGDSVACRSSAATAARAAVSASAPWPSPSTTATSTVLPTGLTRCRSPDCASPGRAWVATPHSISRGAVTDASRMHVAPFFHRHGGALADARAHVEVVHQAPRPREPQSQAAGRRVAVLEGPRHVPDSRALIPGNDHHALAVAVRHDVARDLGYRRSDHRLVPAREPRLRRQIPSPLPRGHDVDVGGNRDQQVVSHARSVPSPARCGAASAGRGTPDPPRDRARSRRP